MMAYALVTGASKGIGKAIAEELAKKRINLILIARSGDLLAKISTEISEQYQVDVKYLEADLSDLNSPQSVLNWCLSNNLQVNILVNNAGYGLSGYFGTNPIADNLNMLQLNMQTPVQLCQLFLPELKKHSKSYILNVASTAAYQAFPGLSLYAASKAFVLHFTRGLRQELNSSNVSVSCVCPGATDTEFIVRAKVGNRGAKTAQMVNMTPKNVAQIAIKGMFNGEAEIIPGLPNKLGVFFAWLLPKFMVEKIAMKLYK